jgi:hypothetical protein
VVLPLEAFFGARQWARAYGTHAGRQTPDWETYVSFLILYGGFWMLIFMYLMLPKVRLLFKPKLAPTEYRCRARRRRLKAGGRMRPSADDEPSTTDDA